MAAARAGADLVLPVHEIGFVLASIVEGAPLPDRKPDRAGAGGPQRRPSPHRVTVVLRAG